MENEYNEKVKLERQAFTRTRWLGSDVRPAISAPVVLDDKGRAAVLFKSDWEIDYAKQRTEGLILHEKPPTGE